MNLDQATLDRWLPRVKQVEDRIRERAFLNIPEQINNVQVAQFTLRHRAILFQIKSPFVTGGKLAMEDIGTFMWVVSLHYDPEDLEKRAAFLSQLVRMPNGNMFPRAIDRYLDRAFMDAPPQSSNGKAIAASFTAGMVHKIAFAYGCGNGKQIHDQIMATPIAVIFQCMKWIDIERDFSTPQFDPLQIRVIQKLYAKADREKADSSGKGAMNGQH